LRREKTVLLTETKRKKVKKVKIMRTKTMLISALLGALGSVSVMAQTNVYSLNAVGYINVTLLPGYNIITCPLIASPDNTIATLLNNTNAQYQNGSRNAAVVYQFSGGIYTAIDSALAGNAPSGWAGGGTETMNPGQAIFFYNPSSTNMYATFVGTVPTGTITNALAPGYNLVGSVLPVAGDLVTNSLSVFTNGANSGRNSDVLYTYAPGVGYTVNAYTSGAWAGGDPTITNVYEGFFFYNALTTTNNWIENYSVNP
jgi:hypothetical protein